VVALAAKMARRALVAAVRVNIETSRTTGTTVNSAGANVIFVGCEFRFAVGRAYGNMTSLPVLSRVRDRKQ
jgi:hypothetical protein